MATEACLLHYFTDQGDEWTLMEAGFVFMYLKCVTTLLQYFLSLIVAHTMLFQHLKTIPQQWFLNAVFVYDSGRAIMLYSQCKQQYLYVSFQINNP